MFYSMLDSIRENNVNAPIFVSITTKCAPNWYSDNAISKAQKSLPSTHKNIYAGVDIDKLLEEKDKYDGCHFNSSGQEKNANAWFSVIEQQASRASLK